MNPTTQELAARVDLLGIVVQELCYTLAPAQRAQAAQAIRHRVAHMATGDLNHSADEALAVDLAPMLRAIEG